MSLYGAIDTAATGVQLNRMWIDVLANNIANVNTVRPTSEDAFQATYLDAREIAAGADGIGRGVQAAELPKGDPAGDMTYEPDNPLADAEGYVRRPAINMSEQMGDLILAQRAFQANTSVIERSKAMYEAAIAIGKGM